MGGNETSHYQVAVETRTGRRRSWLSHLHGLAEVTFPSVRCISSGRGVLTGFRSSAAFGVLVAASSGEREGEGGVTAVGGMW